MEIVILRKEQEEKWLEYIEKNSDNFFELLFDKMKEYKDIKFRFSNDFLRKLYLKKVEVSENDYYYDFIQCFSPRDNLKKLLQYIDFSDFDYEKLNLNQYNIDFMRNNAITLYLNKTYNKDISGLIIENMIIDGSFDGYKLTNIVGGKIVGCKIKNNLNKKGNSVFLNPQEIINKDFTNCDIRGVYSEDAYFDCAISGATLIDDIAVINPQKCKNKDLSNCDIENAAIVGSFDNCNIKNITLNNNCGAKINPQKVMNKDFGDAKIHDAVFVDSFDNCNIGSMNINGCDNAYINGKGLSQINWTRIDYITIVINDDDDLETLKNYISEKGGMHIGDNVTILCNDIYYSELKNFSVLGKCKYEFPRSQLETDIDEVLNSKNRVKKKVK